jgi:hypothetical protein
MDINHGKIIMFAVFGICILAVLFPRSPLSLALVLKRGPTFNLESLLRPELRGNARKHVTLAMVCMMGTFACLSVMSFQDPQTDSAREPYFYAIVVTAGLAFVFWVMAFRSWMESIFRKDVVESAIQNLRVEAEANDTERCSKMDAAAAARKILGPGAGMSLVGVGGFMILAFALLAGLGFYEAVNDDKPINWGMIGAGGFFGMMGLGLVFAGLKIDKADTDQDSG